MQQRRRQQQVEHHPHEQPLRVHQLEAPQSSRQPKDLVPVKETEGYSCLVVEGSDQSRGWFQSLLLSHAGAREGFRRQRAQQLRLGTVQAEGQKGTQGVTAQTAEKRRTTVCTDGNLHDKQKPAMAALDDAVLPQLPFSVAVTHGFVLDSTVRIPNLLPLLLTALLPLSFELRPPVSVEVCGLAFAGSWV